MTSTSILRFLLVVFIDLCFSFCTSKYSRTNMKQILSYRQNVVHRFVRNNHKIGDLIDTLTSQSMSLTSDALVENSPSMTDYEFIDCGDLKRLERFGGKLLHLSVKCLFGITAFMERNYVYFVDNRLLLFKSLPTQLSVIFLTGYPVLCHNKIST
jgi:hypothetical protein